MIHPPSPATQRSKVVFTVGTWPLITYEQLPKGSSYEPSSIVRAVGEFASLMSSDYELGYHALTASGNLSTARFGYWRPDRL